jgi:hypothetical protein
MAGRDQLRELSCADSPVAIEKSFADCVGVAVAVALEEPFADAVSVSDAFAHSFADAVSVSVAFAQSFADGHSIPDAHGLAESLSDRVHDPDGDGVAVAQSVPDRLRPPDAEPGRDSVACFRRLGGVHGLAQRWGVAAARAVARTAGDRRVWPVAADGIGTADSIRNIHAKWLFHANRPLRR